LNFSQIILRDLSDLTNFNYFRSFILL